jgi:hypothetical protein
MDTSATVAGFLLPQVQQLPHATLVAHFGADRAGTIEQAVSVQHTPFSATILLFRARLYWEPV